MSTKSERKAAKKSLESQLRELNEQDRVEASADEKRHKAAKIFRTEGPWEKVSNDLDEFLGGHFAWRSHNTKSILFSPRVGRAEPCAEGPEECRAFGAEIKNGVLKIAPMYTGKDYIGRHEKADVIYIPIDRHDTKYQLVTKEQVLAWLYRATDLTDFKTYFDTCWQERTGEKGWCTVVHPGHDDAIAACLTCREAAPFNPNNHASSCNCFDCLEHEKDSKSCRCIFHKRFNDIDNQWARHNYYEHNVPVAGCNICDALIKSTREAKKALHDSFKEKKDQEKHGESDSNDEEPSKKCPHADHELSKIFCSEARCTSGLTVKQHLRKCVYCNMETSDIVCVYCWRNLASRKCPVCTNNVVPGRAFCSDACRVRMESPGTQRKCAFCNINSGERISCGSCISHLRFGTCVICGTDTFQGKIFCSDACRTRSKESTTHTQLKCLFCYGDLGKNSVRGACGGCLNTMSHGKCAARCGSAAAPNDVFCSSWCRTRLDSPGTHQRKCAFCNDDSGEHKLCGSCIGHIRGKKCVLCGMDAIPGEIFCLDTSRFHTAN